MSGEYTFNMPSVGDKLQIHMCGLKLMDDGEGGKKLTGEFNPVSLLVWECDIGNALEFLDTHEDTMYLNLVLSVKRSPIMVKVPCPECTFLTDFDCTQGIEFYKTCSYCHTDYNLEQKRL